MSKTMDFSQVTVRKQTLAEQVADAVCDAILAGTWQEGDALPTEPELGAQFGVSRAVVRDAVRLLMARGLVEVRHGKGMFVTPPRNPAFADALLLALRRLDATAWDVEEFERMVLPAAVALAAQRADGAAVTRLQSALDDYLAALRRSVNSGMPVRDAAQQPELYDAFAAFVDALVSSAGNPLLGLLAQPLARLHSLRNWDGHEVDHDVLQQKERALLQPIVDAVAAHDADAARAAITRIFQLPAVAEDAMRRTPVGQVVDINTAP